MQSNRNPAPPRTSLPALLLAAMLAACSSMAVVAQPAGIHVSGAGEVAVIPDLARVTLDARREGNDAAALKTELDEVTTAVLAFARSLGIEARDITAAAVNIHPRYRHRDGETTVEGIIASRTIQVTLRRLDNVGELINGALARGVNGVGNVQLDAANRVELERAALDLAIDDARREAGQIATRFGVRLGALVNAGSSGHQVAPVMMMDAMAARSSPKESFAPGEMIIRRDIQATFAIEALPAAAQPGG